MAQSTYIWFTCLRDHDLVKASLASAQKHDPEQCYWLVFDKKEQAKVNEADYEGALVIYSKFQRRGNLRGIKCVRGIIRTYAKAETERVVRVDSDVIFLRTPPWRGDPEYGVYGVCLQKPNMHYLAGCLSTFPRADIPKIRKGIERVRLPWLNENQPHRRPYGEDIVIGSVLMAIRRTVTYAQFYIKDGIGVIKEDAVGEAKRDTQKGCLATLVQGSGIRKAAPERRSVMGRELLQWILDEK